MHTLIPFNYLYLHNTTLHVAHIRRPSVDQAIVACKIASADNHR